MTTEIFCFYLQNRLIQTSQTGGQFYSDTFSIPWNRYLGQSIDSIIMMSAQVWVKISPQKNKEKIEIN